MEHFRLRKYRGPEVWAKVREAYVAGEPGPQVAARFDVGLANLRKKALREGWTRAAAARGSDPLILATQPDLLGTPHDPALSPPPAPAHPAVARDSAIGRAAALLAEGRAAEATALLKAAETLGRLAVDAGPPPEPERTPEEARMAEWEADRAREEQARVVFDEIRAHFRDVALQLANAMLSETPRVVGGDDWCLAALHWRARVLGPEIALSDFAYGVNGGWAYRYWDAVGNLHPLTRDIPEPEDFMVRQHHRGAVEEDLKYWPWNGWVEQEVEVALSERKPPRVWQG
jgi:hypothetical protein